MPVQYPPIEWTSTCHADCHFSCATASGASSDVGCDVWFNQAGMELDRRQHCDGTSQVVRCPVSAQRQRRRLRGVTGVESGDPSRRPESSHSIRVPCSLCQRCRPKPVSCIRSRHHRRLGSVLLTFSAFTCSWGLSGLVASDTVHFG